MSNIQVAADVTPATAMPAAPSTAVAARDAILEHGRRASRRYLEFAALLLLAGLGCGLVSALHYTPLAGTLNAIGLRLSALRPLHTGATVGWIFFAGMAMVHRWMFEHLADRHGARAMPQSGRWRRGWRGARASSGASGLRPACSPGSPC